MEVVIGEPTLKVLCRFLISTVQIAPFHPAGHQCSVRVFDDQICLLLREIRPLFHQFLPATDRFVVLVTLVR